MSDNLCSDCPHIGYPTDKTRCLPCPRRHPRFIACDDCEGSGDFHRRDPQFDDPYLVTRRYGIPCPACDGEGYIQIEDEPVELEDLEP